MPTEFRFPAEWEPHHATWLTWPHNIETWPHNLAAAQSEFEALVRTIAEVETVHILVDEKVDATLRLQFRNHPNVELIPIVTNDSWIRDYGPTFVKETSTQKVFGINWVYNCWGEKYPPFDRDANAASRMLSHIEIPVINSKIVLEGGAIETNGDRTCLTTTSCLLNPNRNPHFSKSELADEIANELLSELQNRIGCEQIILIDPVPIDGDDTDGHIDQVARFVSRDQIVVSPSQWERVETAVDSYAKVGGQVFTLHRLPDPGELKLFGVTLPTSYANFYFANGIVIVPQFGVPNDDAAIAMLKELIPDRTIIGLASRNLASGLGSFHCLTQQQPA